MESVSSLVSKVSRGTCAWNRIPELESSEISSRRRVIHSRELIMAGVQKCPELEVLQQFSLGQLSQADAWPLHRHLIRCKLCTQTVNELKDAARLITSASMISEVRPLEPSALVHTVAAMPAAS